MKLIFKCCVDDSLSADNNANKTVSFADFCLFFRQNDNFTDTLLFMKFKTTSTSQVKVYFGCDGFSLNILTNNVKNVGCLPISSSFI